MALSWTTAKTTTFMIACVAGIGLAAWAVIRIVGTLTPAPLQGPSHGELINTLLTGVTISLAALAVVIAGLAIVGYGAIRKESENAARRTAKSNVTKYLKSTEVQNLILAEVQRLFAEEFAKANEGYSMPEAFSPGLATSATIEANELTKTVGKRRPKPKEPPAQ